jgi:hypothetical protein
MHVCFRRREERVCIGQKALGQLDRLGGRMGPASEDFTSQRDEWRRKHLLGEPYAQCSRLGVIASPIVATYSIRASRRASFPAPVRESVALRQCMPEG